jgi:cell division protein FtsB
MINLSIDDYRVEYLKVRKMQDDFNKKDKKTGRTPEETKMAKDFIENLTDEQKAILDKRSKAHKKGKKLKSV